MRADPRGAGRAHFPWSSWSLRESHRRQVVPGLLFFSCCLQENRGIEWVEAASAILDRRRPSRHARGRARR